MKQLITIAFVVGLTVMVLLNIHIIRHGEGISVRMKETMTFDYTYVDLTDHNLFSKALMPRPVARFVADNGFDKIKRGISRGLGNLKKEIDKQ